MPPAPIPDPPTDLRAAIRASTAKAAWQAYQGEAFKALIRPAKHTALRNLLTAAGEAEVLEELYILFAYQVGRKLLDAALEQELRRAIDAQVNALPADHRGDDGLRLTVAHTYLAHVVRLHRALEAGQRGGRQ